MNLSDVLGKAVGSKEKPASSWMGVVYIFLALLGIALAALPAILARRKAAKLAHKIDVLEEEEEQVRLKATDENFEDQARHYSAEAERLEEEVEAAIKELYDLEERKVSFKEQLAQITNWGDLQ